MKTEHWEAASQRCKTREFLDSLRHTQVKSKQKLETSKLLIEPTVHFVSKAKVKSF